MPKIKAGSIDIGYEISGTGAPLLLIMGFGMPGAAWMPSLPFLGEFRSIYYDNRGTGISDRPEGPYTVSAMAEDASQLLRALQIDSAYVFGISMGGAIAQELAIGHPDQVRKVVLGCTWPGGTEAEPPSEKAITDLVESAKLMSTDPDRALDMLLPLLYPGDFLTAHPEIKTMLAIGLAAAAPIPAAFVDRLLAGLSGFDAYKRLPQIKCPALVIHGEQDALVPAANARLIQKQIPGAELWTIPGAGHAFTAQDPAAIHQRICGWLRS